MTTEGNERPASGTSPSDERLRWALSLAARGFRILPLPPGERVPVVAWKDAMTRDEAVIRRWLEGTDSNYGACPGPSNVILDLDRKDGKRGVENFGLLELEHGELDTLTVESPSGGVHHYLSVDVPAGNSSRGFGSNTGIDVRGQGGYVLGPGCVVGGRPYRVLRDRPVAPAPPWVASRLRAAMEGSGGDVEALFELDLDVAVRRARDFLDKRAPAIEGQNGDDHTYATVALVKDLGISEDRCLELMLEPGGWNDRCAPPWDKGELAAKVRNAYAYGQRRPGAKGGGVLEMYRPDGVEDAPPLAAPGSWIAEHEYTLGTLVAREKRRETVIPDWLPAHGFVALLGRRGLGKSVSMVDMACRIANDMDWHGLPCKTDMHAVYLCGEDDVGAQVMAEAWRERHGVREDNGRLLFYDAIPDLVSAERTQEWAQYLHERIGVPRGGRAVVFLDTWQRATSRAGQSDDEDMQLAVHHAEALAKSLCGPLVGAFHPPKHDEGTIMGSSIIENDTVAIWQMSEHSSGRKLEVTRIKGAPSGAYVIFAFDVVNLGREDEHGREELAVVARKVGGLSDESSADTSEKRSAYAEVIRHLDLRRTTLDPESRPYSVRSLSERVSALTKEAEEGDDMAGSLVGVLSMAGVTNLGQRAIANDLQKFFRSDPRGQDLGDGYKLVLRSRGNNSEFRIVKSGI